jgi:DNA-binding response OmpR family regulator
MINRILLVDDDEALLALLAEMLKSRGYEVLCASNGEEGIDAFKKFQPPVVITDLQMPEIDGREMIPLIKEINNAAVVIVMSVLKEAEVIIDVMRHGVFDYIIKPVMGDELGLKVKRAFDTAELRRMRTVAKKEKVRKLENQLSWARYTENLLQKDYKRLDRTLFGNLHASFTMGAGMGAVLTLLKLISMNAKKEGDIIQIDKDLFDIIEQNVKVAEYAIDAFNKINNIINDEIKLEKIKLIEIYTLAGDIIKDLEKYLKIKKQTILLSEYRADHEEVYIMGSLKLMGDALKELLINAMKFSTDASSIYIIFDIHNKTFNVSIINTPKELENGIKGVPQEYEKLVFEPFYRISKTVTPGYHSYESGIGLSLVEKIAEKHRGTVELYNIMDYSDISKEPVEKVNAVIQVPVVTDEEIKDSI